MIHVEIDYTTGTEVEQSKNPGRIRISSSQCKHKKKKIESRKPRNYKINNV